jgi:mannose-6-phosphate isomerase-like protein (cupin superfamily)
MRPATLVEAQVQPEFSVMRADERGRRAVQWGQAKFEPLTQPIHCAPFSGQFLTLPIGREPALSHTHEGEEWATVLSGVAEITVDGKAHVLREGDCLHFRAHRPHSYSNLASEPALLLLAGRPQLTL